MLPGRSKSSAGRPTRSSASPCAGRRLASATASWPVPPVIRIGARHVRRHATRRTRASRGRARSLSDRIASPGAIGQGTRELRIVPDHAALRLPVPRRGDLVDHLGVRLERAVAVQQSRRDPELLPVLRRQHGAGMLPVGRRAAPDIHRDIPDRAAHHADQLALRVRPDLQVQPAHHAAVGRSRVVVLHERPGDAGLGEALLVPGLGEEAAPIEETRRGQQQHAREWRSARRSFLLPFGEFHQHPAEVRLAEMPRVRA